MAGSALCLCLGALFDGDQGIALDAKCGRCGHLGSEHYHIIPDASDIYCPTACRSEVAPFA